MHKGGREHVSERGRISWGVAFPWCGLNVEFTSSPYLVMAGREGGIYGIYSGWGVVKQRFRWS